MENKRNFLKEIYYDVLDDIKLGSYVYDGVDIVFPGQEEMKKNSIMYSSIPELNKSTIPYYPSPHVYVDNIDTFEKAIHMGEGCAVLNMASSRNPGGGVEKGSMAQEEELCRRSNLLYSLYSFSPLGTSYFDFPTPRVEYPISIEGGIYSPGVSIYRVPRTYKTMSSPKVCSVISVPGIVRPWVNSFSGKMGYKDVKILKRKIRTIFRIAIIHEHSKLVLGALGCGAFHNPPRHVAEIFKEVLGEPEFNHSFEEICFAILEDKNSIRSDNPDGNLMPFVEVFGI